MFDLVDAGDSPAWFGTILVLFVAGCVLLALMFGAFVVFALPEWEEALRPGLTAPAKHTEGVKKQRPARPAPRPTQPPEANKGR